MAYQLKTSGIAANCLMAIAVDPDTNAIKDFASATVTADMTIGGSITVGSQAWDGITRKYFQLAASNYVGFGTNKPSFTFNASNTQRTVIWIGEVAGAGARVFGNNSSEYFAAVNTGLGGATHPTAVIGANTISGTGASLVAGNKRIFGWSLVRGGATNSSFIYSAEDTASSGTVTPKTVTSPNVDYKLSYVGRRNDNTTQQNDKIHAVLIFNTALSQADFDSLRDDWFGELFEVAGGGGATTTITATLASITSSVASKSAPISTISATMANVAGSVACGSGSLVTTIATTLGNIVGSITSSGSLSNGTFTSEVLTDYAGNVLANVSLNFVRFYNDTTGALVLSKTGVSTNGSGIVSFSDQALVSGTTYRVDWETSSGSRRMPRKAAA